MASMLVFLLSGLGMINIGFPGDGGVLGAAVSKPIVAAVDTTATVIFLIAFTIASLIVAFDIHLGAVFLGLKERFNKENEEGFQETDAADIPVTGLPAEDPEASAQDEKAGNGESQKEEKSEKPLP